MVVSKVHLHPWQPWFLPVQSQSGSILQAQQESQSLYCPSVHVDNWTISASSIKAIDTLKTRLQEHVEVTDLSKLHWMLRIEVQHE